MKKYFALLFSLTLVALGYSSPSFAISARAQWLDASHLRLKLPPGVPTNASQVLFSLVDTSQAIRQDGVLRLNAISVDQSGVNLDTSFLSRTEIEYLITRPLKVLTTDLNQNILDTTDIQFAGLLDQVFYYDGDDLGSECVSNVCNLKLWAPTAQNVRVYVYPDSSSSPTQPEIFNCQHQAQGVWSAQLPGSRKNSYYLYEVQVYQPFTGRVETQLVTDPYSKSLAINATRSQMIDENSTESEPAGWNSLTKPALNSMVESVIYELHIRDFSASDLSLDSQYRGTYLAFAQNSAGTRHLRDLAQAGVTHVHLMPFNDFGSVNENKTQWNQLNLSPAYDLTTPQELTGMIRDTDSYNWGYDPVHYFAPDGSYAVQGDGLNRMKETRSMVMALNRLGLRVVQDVVYNHTFHHGLEEASVFDRIVPLYYYRVDDNGEAFTSSCCADTASEHRMMEKLMVDSVVYWARAYKIDGFRFDLMSFHSRATILKIRDALRNLNMSDDGVDGSKILLYGEGWTFGSLYDAHPDEAMTHENSFGSSVGFFNDRLRDAARGGTTNTAEKSDQGFATGLFYDFNQEPANRNTPIDMPSQREKLLHLGDVIKVGLAGNLRDLSFRDHLGNTITGYSLKFRNDPVAFGAVAQENINYVSAHDGYGLWDAIQAKAPFNTPGRTPASATPEERQRIQQLLLAFPLLGQGIPYIEGGSDLLRSKDGDQDSYNSGDFFNRLDWSGQDNFWGFALPPAWKNQADWSFWEPRLRAPEIRATPALIAQTENYFQALLRLRKSSKLFALNTPAEISARLRFIDNDAQAEPGLIAMLLQGPDESLLIFFNASRDARFFNNDTLKRPWVLHPLLDGKIDPALNDVVLNTSAGSIRLPGRTTVVLQIKGSGSKRR